MSSEIVYTDGACSGNGTNASTGGFGFFIAKSSIFDKPIKVNYKGKHMKYENDTMYVTNIRMEGLAIVSTLAVYANILTNNILPNEVFEHMNSHDPFDLRSPKIVYGANELKRSVVQSATIEIVTDSQFWMNVIEKWMPNWIAKKILLEKKNPDILLMLCYYTQVLKQNNIKYKFTHVKSHQQKSRTFHADGNDVADKLATSAINNLNDGFVVQM